MKAAGADDSLLLGVRTGCCPCQVPPGQGPCFRAAPGQENVHLYVFLKACFAHAAYMQVWCKTRSGPVALPCNISWRTVWSIPNASQHCATAGTRSDNDLPARHAPAEACQRAMRQFQGPNFLIFIRRHHSPPGPGTCTCVWQLCMEAPIPLHGARKEHVCH